MDPSCASAAHTRRFVSSGNLGRSWPEAVMFGRSDRSARAMLVGCRAAASNICADGPAGSWLLRCKTLGRPS